jgi:hypothetical protein
VKTARPSVVIRPEIWSAFEGGGEGVSRSKAFYLEPYSNATGCAEQRRLIMRFVRRIMRQIMRFGALVWRVADAFAAFNRLKDLLKIVRGRTAVVLPPASSWAKRNNHYEDTK